MRLIIFSSLLIITTQVAGQQINGKWKGKMYAPNSNTDTVYVEFEIKGKNNNKLYGNNICNFFGGKFAKSTIRGKYEPLKNEVYMEEIRIENTNLPDPSTVLLDEYFLHLDQTGKLSGIVRCKEPAKQNPGYRIACHDNMYIELVKQ